jgi:hypothetical protein
LGPQAEGEQAATANKAISEIQKDDPEIIFLDRDLVHSFGEEVAEFLAKEQFIGRVFITSANPFGVQVISKILGDAKIEFEAVPFSMLGIWRTPYASARRGSLGSCNELPGLRL